MSQHTKGPWTLYVGRGAIAVLKGTEPVVNWQGFDSSRFPEQVMANARLCAAAPDLLAACQLMLDFYHMGTDEFVARYGTGISTRTLGDRARAAIAKACGQEQADG